MAKIFENCPAEDVLMVPMKAAGYTFKAALADAFDNSISANILSIKTKNERTNMNYKSEEGL